MSAHLNPRSCSTLKSVLNRLGDSYQAYFNFSQMHAMATHHGGSGQPLKKDISPNGETMPEGYHNEDMDNFDNAEHEIPTWLAAITRELDDLWQRFQAEEGQPTEQPQHIE